MVKLWLVTLFVALAGCHASRGPESESEREPHWCRGGITLGAAVGKAADLLQLRAGGTPVAPLVSNWRWSKERCGWFLEIGKGAIDVAPPTFEGRTVFVPMRGVAILLE